MKKKEAKSDKLEPEDAVQFLEDIRKLSVGIDEPSQMISIRIPANVLRAVKMKARIERRKYQSLITDYIRQGVFR